MGIDSSDLEEPPPERAKSRKKRMVKSDVVHLYKEGQTNPGTIAKLTGFSTSEVRAILKELEGVSE